MVVYSRAGGVLPDIQLLTSQGPRRAGARYSHTAFINMAQQQTKQPKHKKHILSSLYSKVPGWSSWENWGQEDQGLGHGGSDTGTYTWSGYE